MYNLIKSYSFYKKIAGTEAVDRKLYRNITSDFFKFLSEKILEGFAVVLPLRIGKIQVIGNKSKARVTEDGKIKNLNVDWKRTNALWERSETAKEQKKLVYYDNEHSNNCIFKIAWLKKTTLLKNKSMYKFVPTRTNNRNLNQKIKSGSEYLIIN